jgi:murein DD-endopeptidase MepM/ murein hydrolase activator NlpD
MANESVFAGPTLHRPISLRYRSPVTQWFGQDARWGTSRCDYSWIIYTAANGKQFPSAGHNGLDFGCPKFTPILAAHAGRVLFVGDQGKAGFGRFVRLTYQFSPGYSYETIYAHLEMIRVSVGDIVVAGQEIALSGDTGNSTGPHLHFGLRWTDVRSYVYDMAFGGYVNPAPFRWIAGL